MGSASRSTVSAVISSHYIAATRGRTATSGKKRLFVFAWPYSLGSIFSLGWNGRKHGQPLRHRSRSQPGELPAADTAVVSRPRRRGLSGPACHRPWRALLDLSGVLRADATALFGTRPARHHA